MELGGGWELNPSEIVEMLLTLLVLLESLLLVAAAGLPECNGCSHHAISRLALKYLTKEAIDSYRESCFGWPLNKGRGTVSEWPIKVRNSVI